MIARAIHIHVPKGDVIENTRVTDAGAIRGVAGIVAGCSVLGGRQLVVNRIGIALACTDPLVYECLNASHDRR
jgi:hypothetical protein